jgi:hyperosmotically inducible periplasmic protein
MAYEEERARRSRVVVDTPVSRREVVHTESYRTPENQGVTGTMLAVIVIGAIALATVIILFAMNQQQQDMANTNNASPTAPPQTIVQQPAQQPPVIVQQPAPATQPAPVIINQTPSSASGGATSNALDDSAIQQAIDKKLADDPVLSALGITATVLDGKATLLGTVKSEVQKSQVERIVRSVKGVKSIDNQIVVG